jgi:hypothetical protein
MLVVWLTPKEMIRSVRTLFLLTLLFASILCVIAAPQGASKRKIACKTGENAASCYWAHGRLSFYNGTPSYRMWKIGTNRILAIHSGPSVKRGDDHDNSNPELPVNVERAFKTPYSQIFADYKICPLEPEETRKMQRVCIESAKNIVVDQ